MVLGGIVVSQAHIPDIQYHALLVHIPIQRAKDILDNQWKDIHVLHSDSVMYISPHYPMSIIGDNQDSDDELLKTYTYTGEVRTEPHYLAPRVALFDGLPLENHKSLKKRLTIDDPDAYGSSYPTQAREHGTAMASLIIHGDLSEGNQPIDRPLYVRPILKPPFEGVLAEQNSKDCLVVDLIHRAVRRLFEKDGDQAPIANSIRIINLSYGIPMRAFSRRMSPLGNLLDWLTVTYNVLFVVSAGNHPSSGETYIRRDQSEAPALPLFEQRFGSGTLLKGVLPPGDAMNVLTVGATQNDDGTQLPRGYVDTTFLDSPALYSATGPGVHRSIKPDVYHTGGRERARVEDLHPGDQHIRVATLFDKSHPPGLMVAAPPRTSGELDGVAFMRGTSVATALITRLADQLYQELEDIYDLRERKNFPAPVYFPLIVRSLIVHAAQHAHWPKDFKKHFLNYLIVLTDI